MRKYRINNNFTRFDRPSAMTVSQVRAMDRAGTPLRAVRVGRYALVRCSGASRRCERGCCLDFSKPYRTTGWIGWPPPQRCTPSVLVIQNVSLLLSGNGQVSSLAWRAPRLRPQWLVKTLVDDAHFPNLLPGHDLNYRGHSQGSGRVRGGGVG